jgi:hypothetical protein
VHLRPIKYTWVPRRNKIIEIPDVHTIYTSRKALIEEILEPMIEGYNQNLSQTHAQAVNKDYIRLWKLNTEKTIEQLRKGVKK